MWPVRGNMGVIVRASLLICMLSCTAVEANPVSSPMRVAGTAGVIVGALLAEILLTSTLLVFAGMAGIPVLGGLLVINVLVYTILFLPLLWGGTAVGVAEGIVVLVEAALIKAVSAFDAFQGDRFVRLRWRYALFAAASGNALSYGLSRLVLP